MKKYILLFIIVSLSLSKAFSQQLPSYDRTRQNQVLADRATSSKYFMRMPTGAATIMPAYVPDSLKCGALWYKASPGVDTVLMIYNCLNSSWERYAKTKELAAYRVKTDSLHIGNGLTQIGKNVVLGGTLTTGTSLHLGANELTIDATSGNGLHLINNTNITYSNVYNDLANTWYSGYDTRYGGGLLFTKPGQPAIQFYNGGQIKRISQHGSLSVDSVMWSNTGGTLAQQNANTANIAANYSAIAFRQQKILSAIPTTASTIIAAGDSVAMALAKLNLRQSLDSALFVKRIYGVIHIPNLSLLSAYTGTATSAAVVSNDGTQGIFNLITGTATIDSGVNVASAISGTYWKRDFGNVNGVKVQWWGAKNDNTRDNTVSFRDAARYAGANGIRNIFVTGGGNFMISDSVATHHTYTNWIGDGATTVRMSNNRQVGLMLYHDHCTIDNILFTGVGSDSGNPVRGTPVFIQGASWCTVTRCVITGSGSNGIEVLPGSANDNHNTNVPSHTDIEHNTIITTVASSQVGGGIVVGYSNTQELNYNTVRFNSILGANLLKFGILQLACGHFNVYSDNTVKQITNYGIATYRPSGTRDSSLTDIEISRNKIDTTGVLTGTTNFGSPLYFQGVLRCTAENNTINAGGINSVFATLPMGGISGNASQNAIIKNNIITNCTAVPAINFSSSFESLNISDNITSNSSIGLQVANSNHVVIHHNSFRQALGVGINLTADTAGFGTRPTKYVGKTTGFDFIVDNNQVESVNQSIAVTGKTYDTLSMVKLLNNHLKSSYSGGAIVLASIKNSFVNGNTGVLSNTTYGIQIQGITSNCNVNYNAFYNSGTFTYGFLSSGPVNQAIGNSFSPSASMNINSVTYTTGQSVINGNEIQVTTGNYNTYGDIRYRQLGTQISLTADVTGLLPDANISSAATWNAKQAALVSGTNIKTINSASLLGSGNILLQTPLVAGTDYLTPAGTSANSTLWNNFAILPTSFGSSGQIGGLYGYDNATGKMRPFSAAIVNNFLGAAPIIPLKDFYTDVSNVTTTATLLYGYTVLANTVSATGLKISFDYSGTFASNTNNKTLTVSYAAQGITFNTTSNGGSWTIRGYLIRTSSSTFRMTATLISDGKVQNLNGTSTGVDFTVNQAMSITATGISTADITAAEGTLQLKPSGP